MGNASKLLQLLALALAAMALAASGALATTVAEVGTALATERGSMSINNGAVNIVCDSSTLTLTMQENLAEPTNGVSATFTVDTLGFTGQCTEDISVTRCNIVTVQDLPDTFTVTAGTPSIGTHDAGQNFFTFTFTCGMLTCVASTDATLQVEITNGRAGSLRVNNQAIDVGGDAGCSIGLPGNWDGAWTINQTDDPTGNNTTTITA